MIEPRHHTWAIEGREIDRHVERRGRRHGFDRLTPASTALVVVDMTPFFVDQNPYALGCTAVISRLAEAVRTAGGVVAWTVPALVEPSTARREFLGDEVATRYASADTGGPIRRRLWPGFALDDDDIVVEKTRPSAFFPGSSDLHERLVGLGIDTIVACGTVANVCVEATVRDASALDYRPVIVADATAAATDAMLNATLRTVYRSFGDVRSADDLIRLLVDEGDQSATSPDTRRSIISSTSTSPDSRS